MSADIELKISGDSENFIVLKVPSSVTDGGASRISVQITAGAWSGRPTDVDLGEGELLPFLQELAEVISAGEGEARLETSEGHLDLQVEAGLKGRFTVSGYLSTGVDRQVTLEFSFDSRAEDLKPVGQKVAAHFS